jgi:hypothetical protein
MGGSYNLKRNRMGELHQKTICRNFQAKQFTRKNQVIQSINLVTSFLGIHIFVDYTTVVILP